MPPEPWTRLWARRWIFVRKSPLILIAGAILYHGLAFTENVNTAIIDATIGVSLLALSAMAISGDWNRRFSPRFWWVVPPPLTFETLKKFCDTKGIPIYLEDAEDSTEGDFMRVGFITEDDLVRARLSL